MNIQRTIIFDIDDTLVQSFEFDEQLYIESVEQVTELSFNPDWSTFPNITDSGILTTFWERQHNTKLPSSILARVEALFTEKVRAYVSENTVESVDGAVDFFDSIKHCNNTKVAFATGGWRATALLKLNSAGFDITGIPLASSNDHHIRSQIMLTAAQNLKANQPIYFGDGPWDKRTCEELNWPLIAVGNRIEHTYQIKDFSDPKRVNELLTEISSFNKDNSVDK